MEFFKNAIEILELLVKALNGVQEKAFANNSTQNAKIMEMHCKVFKPP